jgi:hypothetical protein
MFIYHRVSINGTSCFTTRRVRHGSPGRTLRFFPTLKGHQATTLGTTALAAVAGNKNIEHDGFTMKNRGFTMKKGRFTMKNGGFTMKNCGLR